MDDARPGRLQRNADDEATLQLWPQQVSGGRRRNDREEGRARAWVKKAVVKKAVKKAVVKTDGVRPR